MKLTMVGTGYVGVVTGACLANSGNDVTCLDIDAAKIAMLNRGRSPIYEPGLEAMIIRNAEAGRLVFTLDRDLAYRDAEAIFICVGTPSGADGGADLTHVFQAADEIAAVLEDLGPDQDPKLIVVKSTVPVGTTHAVGERIRSRTSAPFRIANNPEFLKEGAAINDFLRPDRVVCGVDDVDAGEMLRDLYEPFVMQGNPILVMDVRSSEMVKYASNAMLACKISFVNEIARLCEHYGADVKRVRDGMCSDHRIGNQFFYPGLGYGGSCFPKDTLAVVGMGRDVGYACVLNDAVHQVNQNQRDYFWNKVVTHFNGDVSGKTLAVWGVAFKPETDDIREAPSMRIVQNALDAGATVRVYDPVALDNLRRAGTTATMVEDMHDVLNDADALIICTEWSEFRHPNFEEMSKRLKQQVIFDGRNIYRRKPVTDAGFVYYAVGRPVAHPGNDDGADIQTKSASRHATTS